MPLRWRGGRVLAIQFGAAPLLGIPQAEKESEERQELRVDQQFRSGVDDAIQRVQLSGGGKPRFQSV